MAILRAILCNTAKLRLTVSKPIEQPNWSCLCNKNKSSISASGSAFERNKFKNIDAVTVNTEIHCLGNIITNVHFCMMYQIVLLKLQDQVTFLQHWWISEKWQYYGIWRILTLTKSFTVTNSCAKNFKKRKNN